MSDEVEETTSEAGDEEVLSEEEKDALLAGVSAGVIGEDDGSDIAHEVKPYEIRPDDYINYGSYPLLQSICQQMAKRLATQWSTLLRQPIDVSAEETFTASFATAVSKLRAPVITTKLALAPMPRHSLVLLDNNLLTGLVEAFFGFVGGGATDEDADTPAPMRQQFTQGELRVSELSIERFVDVIAPAWEKLIALQPEILDREFDPLVGTGVTTKESMMVCKFLVQTGVHSGFLYFLLPHEQIAEVADELEGANNARNVSGDPHWRACIEQQLSDTMVSADVLVGDIQLPLRRIVALKAGDLLSIDAPELARLSVEDELRAMGHFGQHDACNAFRLTAWLPGNRNSNL